DGVPILREALHDEDREVRLQALVALARVYPSKTLGPNADPIAADVMPLMQTDPDPDVRQMAEKTLWYVNPKTAAAETGWGRFESLAWGFVASFPSPPVEKTHPAAVGPLVVRSFMAMRGALNCTVAI